ncbi:MULTISPECIES: glycosyltransferase family 9 protein [unclassified Massilia]|uniref:glycosyltransferase family 9 protein n=1 Tax=unclassified Massilia TaxID=2609279 RepID=UPI0009E7D83E|nr:MULTISPECIES: glycosyltransferase family 9 protein [unclassified Massilia]
MKPAGEHSTGTGSWRNRVGKSAFVPALGALDADAPAAQAPLVPPALLRQADKILFIAHLALGDFAYLQSGFQAFARAYPHLKIHLWVDERRRTSRASEWPHLKKYALYDWLAECPYIDKVYAETYSPQAYRASLEEARREDYPVVVSLAVLERHKYALMARSISPHGFVVGQKKRVRPYDLPKHLIYRKLDAFIPPYSVATHPDQHISDIYAGWFDLLFGLDIPPAARFPVLDIADKWIDYARTQFADWGFMRADGKPSSVVFVNGFSKSVERSWPLERIIGLIRTMRCEPDWCDAGFVVNVVPEELARARELFAKAGLERSFLFSAEDNFFQLPAILSLCELIISVETAVMHLANAVHVPVIALMRQSSPEWVPIDKANSTVITAPHRKDWVDKIGVQDVMAVLAARRP